MPSYPTLSPSSRSSLRRKPPPSSPPTPLRPSLPPRPTITSQRDYGDHSVDYFDTSFADVSCLSLDSPKPMGPKNLLDYVLPSSPPVSTPYPITPSKINTSSTATANPPYPINEPFLDSDYSPERFSPSRIHDHFLPDVVTPTRIPHLQTSLDFTPQSVERQAPALYENDAFYSSSPLSSPSSGSPIARAVEPLSSSGYSISPLRSSPTYNFLSSAARTRVLLSNSPSPKRYNQFPVDDLYADSEGFSADEDTFLSETDFRPDDSNDQFRDHLTDHFNDQQNPYLTSPTYNFFAFDDVASANHSQDTASQHDQFDYSVLPDLPSIHTVHSESSRFSLDAENPVPHENRYSISSVESASKSRRVSISRKNQELPPIPFNLPSSLFAASQLLAYHLSSCKQVWKLSAVYGWCLKLSEWLSTTNMSKTEFKKAIVKLLVFHRRESPVYLVMQNAEQIVRSLTTCGALKEIPAQVSTPVQVEFVESINVGGILSGLAPCYSQYGHLRDDESTSRCYSPFCDANCAVDHQKYLQSVKITDLVLEQDWGTHWKLTALQLKGIDPHLTKRQSLVFDLLRYEQTFIQRAKCFVEQVGPEFTKAARVLAGSAIVAVTKFENDIMEPTQELVQIHENHLFRPLLKILSEDGMFVSQIDEIARLYCEWAVRVEGALKRYMGVVPMIENLLHNETLKTWVDVQVRKMDRVKELKVNGPLLLISTFNSRYQQLPLQLEDVRSLFEPQDSEYASITKAIDSLKLLGQHVNDEKHGADNTHELKKLKKELVWKSGTRPEYVNLALASRKFMCRGDLSRRGDLRIKSHVNHVILLDNFLIIAERMKGTDNDSPKYKVSEAPIPVRFLLVEEKFASNSVVDMKPIVKTLTNLSAPSSTSQLMRNGGVPDPDSEPLSFPFKVRFAGRGKPGSYTFSTKTDNERQNWLKALMLARTRICIRLAPTEPYVLSPISNTVFAYSLNNKVEKLQLCAPHDAVYDMATESLESLRLRGYAGDLSAFLSSKLYVLLCPVLAMAIFELDGVAYYLAGLNNGLYCRDSTGMWKKILMINDVTRIRVLPHLNIVLVLANRKLFFCTIDAVLGVYYEECSNFVSMLLSESTVLFLETGVYNDTDVVIFAKRKSSAVNMTTIVVAVPETDNGGIFSRFKDIMRIQISAECWGVSVFNTHLAIATAKGMEMWSIGHQTAWHIPEFPNDVSGGKKRLANAYSEMDNLRRLIASCKPMGLFKLNNNSELLLVYNDLAVFTDKTGKPSRFLPIRFGFKAKSIAFVNNHLFLTCSEVIEVWSVSDTITETGKLVQTIPGKEITMVSNEHLCFTMANPKVPGSQLVFQMERRAL